MLIIGLTGGMGMGKSTVAALFRRAKIPVFDADHQVHRLQAPHGAAVAPIGAAFPGTVHQGIIDRPALRRAVIGNEDAIRRLEAIIHPLVHQAEKRFLAANRRAGRAIVVLDIPLLFENKREKAMDLCVVVSAPARVQLQRLRKRFHMTDSQIAAIIARQMPDAEKRARADVVIRNGLSRHKTARAVTRLLHQLRKALP